MRCPAKIRRWILFFHGQEIRLLSEKQEKGRNASGVDCKTECADLGAYEHLSKEELISLVLKQNYMLSRQDLFQNKDIKTEIYE